MTDIDERASIGEGVVIGSFSTIEGDVVIGDNTWIGPNVVILDGTRIGSNCKIHSGAVLGGIPQDLKFENEYSELVLGDFVTVREYCTLNRGTKQKGVTYIDDHALIMAYSHVAHDCHIGKNAILANSVHLAGHVEVGDWAIISALSAVHQFVKIGEHAMISGGSLVRMDVPPFVKAAREPLSYVGVNSIGLERRGFDQSAIDNIHKTYDILFVKNKNLGHAMKIILNDLEDFDQKANIVNFIEKSERGLMKGFRQSAE
jgi:UDP-N-acetylglucosamine acyltransferase